MNPKYKTFLNKVYEAYVKRQACLVCGVLGVDLHHCWHGRNNSYLCIPLCREHHRKYHGKNWKSFELLYKLDLKFEIINLLSEFLGQKELT